MAPRIPLLPYDPSPTPDDLIPTYDPTTDTTRHISLSQAVTAGGATTSPATFTTNGTIKQTVYNVRDYGAVGDGVTDDHLAIHNACAAAIAAGGGIVYLPHATYYIGSTIASDGSNVTVMGDGIGATILLCGFDGHSDNADLGVIVFRGSNSETTPPNNNTVKNLSINLNGNPTNGVFWRATETAAVTAYNFTLEKVEMYDRGVDNTGSTGCLKVAGQYSGINGTLNNLLVKDCIFRDGVTTDSSHVTGDSIRILSWDLHNVHIENTRFSNTFGSTININGGSGSYIDYRRNWVFDKCEFYNTVQLDFDTNYGDIVDNTRSGFDSIKVVNCHFESLPGTWSIDAASGNQTHYVNILVYNANDVLIQGNSFHYGCYAIAPGFSAPIGNEIHSYLFTNNQVDTYIQLSDPDGTIGGIISDNIFINLRRGDNLGGYGVHGPTIYDNNLLINCVVNNAGSGNDVLQTACLLEDGGNVVQNNLIYNDNILTAPSAPTVATGAAGVLTGAYLYKITFVTQNNIESTGGTTSASVSPSSQKVSLTNIPTGPAGTYRRFIYRTAAGGSNGTQEYVDSINDNQTTTYTDNIADSALGKAVPTTNGTANNMKHVFAENAGNFASVNVYPNVYKNNTILGSGPSGTAFFLDSGFAHVIENNTGLTETLIQNQLALTSPSVTNLASTDIATNNWNVNGTRVKENLALVTSGGGTGTATAFTIGSIIFAGSSGIYSQDNNNLFWDNTNKRLGIGTAASPNRTLEVGGSARFQNNGNGIEFVQASSTLWQMQPVGTTTAFQTASLQLGLGIAPTSLLHLADAGNITFGTTTGTQIGTSTSQKLAHYGSTPVVQPNATTDLGTVLSSLGLRASGTAFPITTTGAVSTGSLTLGTVGNKLNITTGTNASAGTGTLAAGTATISTTAVTSSSLIFLTDTSGSTGQLSVGTKTAGTSFVVNSSLITDTSTFNWWIIN